MTTTIVRVTTMNELVSQIYCFLSITGPELSRIWIPVLVYRVVNSKLRYLDLGSALGEVVLVSQLLLEALGLATLESRALAQTTDNLIMISIDGSMTLL